MKKFNKFSPYLNKEFVQYQKENIVLNVFEQKTKKMYFGVNVFCGSEDSTFNIDFRKVQLNSGIAHLLEHLLFILDEDDKINNLINKGFDINGATGNSGTYYYIGGIKEDLMHKDLFLTLIDIIGWINLDNTGFQREKQIVIEEASLELNSKDYLIESCLGKNFYAKTGLESPIVGKKRDIENMTIEQIKMFYDSFYNIENMEFCLFGDFSFGEIEYFLNKMSKFIFDIRKKHECSMLDKPKENVTKIVPSFESQSDENTFDIVSNSITNNSKEFHIPILKYDKIDIRELRLVLSLLILKLNDEFNDEYRMFLENNDIKINDIDIWYKNFNDSEFYLVIEIKNQEDELKIFKKCIEFIEQDFSEQDFDIILYSKKLELIEKLDDSIEELSNDLMTQTLFYNSNSVDFNIENDVNVLQFSYKRFNEVKNSISLKKWVQFNCIAKEVK